MALTGKSTREVTTVMEELDDRTIGVASIVKRTESDTPFGTTPSHLLPAVDFLRWRPEDCPRSAEGKSVFKTGSRPVV